jgi:hypothetical protein
MNHFPGTKHGPSRSGWRGCWPHFLSRATTCSDRYQKPSLPPRLALQPPPANPRSLAAMPRGRRASRVGCARRRRRCSPSRSASADRPRTWRFPAGARSGLLSPTGNRKLGVVNSYSDCPTVPAIGGRRRYDGRRSIGAPSLPPSLRQTRAQDHRFCWQSTFQSSSPASGDLRLGGCNA